MPQSCRYLWVVSHVQTHYYKYVLALLWFIGKGKKISGNDYLLSVLWREIREVLSSIPF